MKVLADKYLQNLHELIPGELELVLFDPEGGLPDDILNYDALLIRTVTKVNRNTFPDFGNIKFIGSATAGFDHVDVDYVNENGVAFARAAGCNANAVGEYVLTVLYRWAYNNRQELCDKKVGVVGVGYTGTAVSKLLNRLKIETVLYDPPREERDPEFISAVTEELLACDILTFHTPLTSNGPYPTYYMCNRDWLHHGFDLVVNAARGGVIDEQALLEAHETGKLKGFVLDVWENEPFFSDETAIRAFIHTPHIAGYSRQAKWRASAMVVRELCSYFGLKCPPAVPVDNVRPEIAVTGSQLFSEFLWLNSNINRYHKTFQKLIELSAEIKGEKFAELRSASELRSEFTHILKQVENRSFLPEETSVFLRN